MPDNIQLFIMADYMKPSLDKYAFLFRTLDKESLDKGLFVARRKWKSLFDYEELSRVLTIKASDEYKEYSYELVQHESEGYAGEGYWAKADGEFAEEGFPNTSVENLSEEWKETLIGIFNYCKKRIFNSHW